MKFGYITVPEEEYIERRQEGSDTIICLYAERLDNGLINAIECFATTDGLDENELERQCAEWKASQDTKTLQMARSSKLSEITAYDKSEAVNSFILNGQSVWLDYETRSRVYDGNERLKLMGRTETTLWLNSTCFNMSIEQAQSLIASIEVYAKDCYNVTEQHKVEVKALATYEDVAAYDITAGYPEKIELNIDDTNIISL